MSSKKGLTAYEAHNMAYLKEKFEENQQRLRSEMARYKRQLELYENVKRRVKEAKNSIERKKNYTAKQRNNSLKKRFNAIQNTLRRNRNYGMHVMQARNGEVTTVQAPSFTNMILRGATIKGFNSKKDFLSTPEALVERRPTNDPPTQWRGSDASMKPDIYCEISKGLLKGGIGKWARDDKFIKEGSTVLLKLIGPNKFSIMGVFKEYPPAAVAANPDLRFCSERYWIENHLMYVEGAGGWKMPEFSPP